MDKILGDRLAAARSWHHLTQEDVARQVEGLTAAALSNYERGTRDPDTGLMARLAAIYAVTTDWLLGRTDDPRPGAPFVLPKEVDDLSPEMRAFLDKEAAAGWPHIRLVYDAVSKGLRTSDLEQVLALLIQVKQREESGEDRKT